MEANAGFVFKMIANPRSDSPDTRFFLQAYKALENGKLSPNEGENRLQLFFDEKPTKEQCQALKHGGFRWVPSQGAWQRQLTCNAIYAADQIDFIRPESGGSISALQPYNRKQRETPDVGGDR